MITVNDAVYPLWFADIAYACDGEWWKAHRGLPGFEGEKWSSHGNQQHDNKLPIVEEFGLSLIKGKDEPGFSVDPSFIHYGNNSGFQAINLGLHLTEKPIMLVGFDLRPTENGRRHLDRKSVV